MKFSSITNWVTHYMYNLDQKLIIVPERYCRIWTGGPKVGKYGQVRVFFPVGNSWVQRTVSVHRLTYMLNIPTYVLEPKGYDVSHLCHEPRCCNFQHLSLEPHSVNTQRSQCKQEGHCFGHRQFKSCQLDGQ